MAEGTIKVSTGALRSTSSSVKTINGSLYNNLSDIQAKMQSLRSSWQSEAADAIQTKFNATAQKYFEAYKQIIDNYCVFLEHAAETYETTETSIKTNAEAFNV